MELRWKASFSATCLHAVKCRYEGLEATDLELEQILAEPSHNLIAGLQSAGLPPDQTLDQLVNFSGEVENNRQLVQLALTRLRGSHATSEEALSYLTAAVAGLESALLAERPQLVNELAVRGKPLQQQWESRGPGLIRQVSHFVGEEFLVDSAEVVLVAPYAGGHGRAHLQSNRVTFEAVLTNSHDELPEPLRLGWLLAQLHADLPVFSESITPGRMPVVARLATLPLILAAAEVVEWASLTKDLVHQALECWHVNESVSVEMLLDWWRAYESGQTPWKVALAGLDQLLQK